MTARGAGLAGAAVAEGGGNNRYMPFSDHAAMGPAALAAVGAQGRAGYSGPPAPGAPAPHPHPDYWRHHAAAAGAGAGGAGGGFGAQQRGYLGGLIRPDPDWGV